MRDRQPAWSEKHLPHNIYMSTLYIVRDYPRAKAQRDAIIDETPPQSIGRSEGLISQPTERKAIKLVDLNDRCTAIENALKALPAEYQDGVIRNIIYGIKYPSWASKNTWSQWRMRFLIKAAENLHLV